MRLRSFRLSLRFVLPLFVVLALCAYAVVPLVDSLTLRWFVRDLDIRSRMLANTLHDPLFDYVPRQSEQKITELFERVVQDERLYALAFCAGGTSPASLKYRSQGYPDSIGCHSQQAAGAAVVRLPLGPVHVSRSTLEQNGEALGTLVLLHDMSFIERRSADTRNYVIALFAALAVIVSLLTVVIAHLSWRGWMQGVRSLLRGGLCSFPAPEYR